MKRNRNGQECRRCAGWVEPGEGILSRLTEYSPWDVEHEECPPEGQRKAAPRRANELHQACARCWAVVPAGAGLLIAPAFPGGAWQVEHNGTCPPYAGGYSGPTWTVSHRVAGRKYKYPAPSGGYRTGQVLRADVDERTHQVPADAPGRRPGRHDGRVSAVFTVVAEAEPQWCEDADGNQPSDLIGEDGWFFRARVRPATAEEAAPLLTEEADARADAELRARARQLLAWRYGRADSDILHPNAAEVQELHADGIEPVDVPLWPEFGQPHPNRLVEIEGVALVTLAYNGADGDTWDASNWGSWIALWHPLTPERAQLLADLRARYGAPTPPREGAPADGEH